MSRHIILMAVLAALAALPQASRADEQTILVYPRIYNFPGQQLCQVDRSDRRYREFCAPQSYYAYGAFGYRPLGTYRPYHAARVYRVAPSAKIVHVHPEH